MLVWWLQQKHIQLINNLWAHSWSVFNGLLFNISSLWRKWIGFLLLDSIYFGCGRFQHDFKGHSPLHGHNERTDHFWKPDPLRFISAADTCLVEMGHLSPSWPTALAVTPQGDLHSLSQVTHWEDIPKRLGVFGPFLSLTLRFLLLKHL